MKVWMKKECLLCFFLDFSLLFPSISHKTFMQTIFLSLLGFFVRTIIQLKKPYIIGVTGTVGKTTITTHIATFLASEFGEKNVMISPYHYNGEFGLPLSIIGTKTGWKNPFRWIYIFFVAFSRWFRPYPRYLILEYGIDHPWEMDFLLSIAVPDIGIISPIAPNHLEQFWTLDNYRNEKLRFWEVAKRLIAYEWLRQYIDKEALYYSMGGMSDIDAFHLHLSVDGVRAQVSLKESTYDIFIPAFWAYQVENILPVYGISHVLGIDSSHIGICSHKFLPEAGRSSILKGKWESVIIDGSYNGGYESLCRGIDSVLPFCATHRILFLLGDMRELGEHTEAMHNSLASYILDHVDQKHDVEFFLVGPFSEQYLFPLLQKNYPTYHSLSSQEMGNAISKILRSRDKKPTIIYVKWSQNTIFLEEGIKKFLSDVSDEIFLCRQTDEWKKKKDVFFSNIEQ